MFDEFLLPGTVSFKETLAIYFEGIKEFFEDLAYRIAQYELMY